jgi:hypothetical protein
MGRKVVFDFDGVLQEKGQKLPLTKLADLLFFDLDYDIIILTARNGYDETYVADTLLEYGVPYSTLIMAPLGTEDYSEWKLRIVKKLSPIWLIFDDNPKTIELFQKADLPIVAIRSDYYNKEG